jgi:hypothetical protein
MRLAYGSEVTRSSLGWVTLNQLPELSRIVASRRPARYTIPVPGPPARFDYVLVSPKVEVERAVVPSSLGSDQLPRRR